MAAKCLPLTRYPRDSQVRVGDLRITKTWRPPGLAVPAHAHELACLALSVGGPCDETIGRTWRHVERHTLIVRPGGVPHANRYPGSAPARGLIVELNPAAVRSVSEHTRVLEAPGSFESPRYVAFGRRLDAELRMRDAVSGLALESLIYELIVSASRESTAKTNPPAWLARVQEFLRSEFARSIALADVAAVAGVHPAHAAKVFRRATGATIGDYVRQLRTDHAAALIRAGRLSLAEIAQASGFHDQSHLARVFGRRFRLSPGRYRRQIAT